MRTRALAEAAIKAADVRIAAGVEVEIAAGAYPARTRAAATDGDGFEGLAVMK
jgi:hypothetical protein